MFPLSVNSLSLAKKHISENTPITKANANERHRDTLNTVIPANSPIKLAK